MKTGVVYVQQLVTAKLKHEWFTNQRGNYNIRCMFINWRISWVPKKENGIVVMGTSSELMGVDKNCLGAYKQLAVWLLDIETPQALRLHGLPLFQCVVFFTTL
jgi:hypothetical protein